MYSVETGRIGSTNISSDPPQISPLSYLGFWFRSNVKVVGRSRITASCAACHTSASTHPPPTVPTIDPSSRTSIFAVLNDGTDPRTEVIVARLPLRPALRNATISSKIPMDRTPPACKLTPTETSRQSAATTLGNFADPAAVYCKPLI